MSKRKRINLLTCNLDADALQNCVGFMKLYSAALYISVTYGSGPYNVIGDKGMFYAHEMLCAQQRNIAKFGKMPLKIMLECCELGGSKLHEYVDAKHATKKRMSKAEISMYGCDG